MPERILIASDHAGFELKEELEHRLADLGFEVDDLGTDSAESDRLCRLRASAGASACRTEKPTRGVLLCGTGLGMSYTANRYPHVRAAVAWTSGDRQAGARAQRSNVLVLPARFV